MRPLAWTLPLAMMLSAEMSAHSQDALPDSKELFQKLDRNKDGKLAADEIPQEQARFFERLLRIADKNEDGVLTQDEFQKAHEADAGPGLPLNGIGGPGGGRGPGNFKQHFEMMDRNKDGQITKDEVPEFARERLLPLFERLGKDSLSLEDFRKLEGPLAGGEGPNPEKMFQLLDTNGDGKLSAEDAPKDRAKRMLEEYLQRSGQKPDAVITKDEFLATVANWAKDRESRNRPGGPRPEGDGRPHFPMFVRKLDANQDGRISKSEWSKAAELFGELDANEDGELDMHELMGPPPEGRGPFGGRMNPEGDRNGPPPEGSNAGPLGERFFQRLDKDGDGKLSKDEVPDRMRERFPRLDKNDDGFLTPDELRDALPGRPGNNDGPGDKPRPKRPAAE